MTTDINTRSMLSEAKFFEGYSRWNDELLRYENWDDSVDRVMNMHKQYYADKITGNGELLSLIGEATEAYKDKYVLGAQRALQFGGDQLLKHQMRLYNCVSSYADRPAFFNEVFYILLTGAGAGFSVQTHHIAKLPNIIERKKQAKVHIVEDSIEGWADSIGVLLSSYFEGGGAFPEYEGRRVYFDLSQIRPRGAHISGGFKAPGPEPLRRALDKVEYLLQGIALSNTNRLRSIDVYDVVMHTSDAVLAGGVRRSATICLFSLDDELMLKAKTGNWFVENPQRGRSNNSAVIVRDEVTQEQFANIMKSVKEFGEPGFVFVNSREHTTNPCVEIGMFPQFEGQSGWQGCNLTEINGSKCISKEEFFKACRTAGILGTLQAGYTSFKYVSDITKKIFDREALLGCSITGWMNNPHVLFDEETLREGARIIKKVNRQVAALLGINPAARTTCVKPSGNASVVLMTASGIHPEHSKRYIRNVQMNKESEVAQLVKTENPYMVEESVWSSNGTDYVLSFPIVTNDESIYKDQMYGKNLLEKVKLVQQSWVEEGTDESLCVDPTVRHNVSNTVTVLPDQWDEVEEYVFANRKFFAGISFLGASGDKDYAQAPNSEVLSESELLGKYGVASFFASGLVVDCLKSFPDLWSAIAIAVQAKKQDNQEKFDNQADWIRRYHKFAKNYFSNDLKQTEYCLKDIYLLYKWEKIQQNFVNVDFTSQLQVKKFTDIDTMGAAACVGNGCEI